MSDRRQKIINAFRSLGNGEAEIWSGTVKSVDEAAGTMEVLPDPDDAEFVVPAMLRSCVKDLKGIVLIPKVGSEVTIAMIELGGEFTIVNASELDKVLIDVPKLQIKCDEVVINNGDNGEVLIKRLVEKNHDILKQFSEDLKTAISAGLDAVGIGSAASGTAGKTAFETAMIGKTIVFEEMGNTKFKH